MHILRRFVIQDNQNSMKDNFVTTFTRFLKVANIRVTETTAKKYIETHPDYPSMLAYSDALDTWNVENAAIRIAAEQLTEMPTPFITFSNRKGGTFSLIKSIGNDIIERFDTESGWIKDKLEHFYADWSGVVLLAEPTATAGEKDYETNRKKETLRSLRIPMAITLLGTVLLLAFSVGSIITFASILLLIAKTGSVIITTLLLVKSIDTQNAFVNKLCNNGTKFSCQSILESKAAKLTNWLSWSDVGFVYGVGSLIGLLFCLQSPEMLNHFFAFNLLTSSLGVIFSLYSVYYQGVVAKMWCPLCLGVMALFWVEAGLSLWGMGSFSLVQFQNYYFISSLLIAFLVPVVFLLLHKPTAIAANTAQATETELNRLKSNPEIFNALLVSQRAMPHLPQGMGVVILGNPSANHELVVVTNPLCGWCGKMHHRINEVLAQSPNLRCKVVFLTNPNDVDISARIARTIFSLPTAQQHHALDAWFARNDQNFEAWYKALAATEEKEVARLWETEHRTWANEAEIKSTPTLFFNGQLLPQLIQVEDLALYTRFSHQTAEAFN